MIFERAFKAVAGQHRLARQRVLANEPAMAGQMLAGIFQPVAVKRQQIIERQSRLQLGAFQEAGVIQRQQEGQGPDQMRRHPHQSRRSRRDSRTSEISKLRR